MSKLIQTMFIVATATHLKRSKLESYNICILGLQELRFLHLCFYPFYLCLKTLEVVMLPNFKFKSVFVCWRNSI